MKKKNCFLLLMVIVLISCNHAKPINNLFQKTIVVCEKDKSDQLEITADDLLLFFSKNYPTLIKEEKPAKFAMLKVINRNNYSYLIARDTVNAKTYALDIKLIENNLILDISTTINICQCVASDETAFNINSDGSISGCISGNHTISKIEEAK